LFLRYFLFLGWRGWVIFAGRINNKEDMNARKGILIVAVLTLLLTSCKSWYATVTDNIDRVQLNMTMDEVREVMGKADYRSFERNEETWEYRTRVLDGDYDVVTIKFRDGIVISMNSFRELHPKFAAPQPEKKAE
jgi:hypothetical protein